jgi:hypothetical protein
MLAAEVSPNAGAAAAAVESKTKSLKGSIDQMRLLDTDQSRRPQWESWHNLIIETRNDLNRILSEAQKRTSENAGQ